MDQDTDSAAQLLVRFLRKASKFSAPETCLSVSAKFTNEQLQGILRGLLANSDVPPKQNDDFDLFIENQILENGLSLDTFLKRLDIHAEKVIDVFYSDKQPSPIPLISLQHPDWVSAVHSNDSFILTGSYDERARLWDTNGTLKCEVHAHDAPIKCCTFLSTDSSNVLRFAVGGHGQSVNVYEWDSLKPKVGAARRLLTMKGHAGSVDCLAPTLDGSKMVTGSTDTMIKIWSLSCDENDKADADGQRVTLIPHASRKRKLDTDDLQNNEAAGKVCVPLVTLSGHKERVSAVCWLRDATEVCSAGWDHSLRIWDAAVAECKSTIPGNKAFLSVSARPSDGLLATGSTDRHVRLYDARSTSNELVRCTLTSHTNWVSAVRWAPANANPHMLVSVSLDTSAKMWDVRSPKAPLFDLLGHTDKILAADWSSSLILTGAADNTLKIFRPN